MRCDARAGHAPARATWMLALAGAAALCGAAAADDVHEVSGVEVPRAVEPEWLGEPLALNGAGGYRRYFMQIYVAALYLPELRDSAEGVVAAVEEPKRLKLFFTYGAIDGERMLEAWEAGLDERVAGEQREAMAWALEEHREAFAHAVEEGDEVAYDYHPERGTRITHNGEVLAEITEPRYRTAFHQALLAYWLGEEPVSDALRSALLGDE